MKKIILILTILASTSLSACSFKPQVLGEGTPDLRLIAPTITPPSIPEKVGKPYTIAIPQLEVKAQIEEVGLDAEKRMDVPKNWWHVGWYALGPKPGEKGKAVLAGHLDSPTGPAVFASLSRLKVGDVIEITDEWGEDKKFVVEKTAVYKDATFPIQEVFGRSEEQLLNLITCQGVFDRTARNYSDRLVVTARLVQERE